MGAVTKGLCVCPCVSHMSRRLVQALVSMHATGRGMYDLKPENIVVKLAAGGVAFERATLIDLGGSGAYKGEQTCRSYRLQTLSKLQAVPSAEQRQLLVHARMSV